MVLPDSNDLASMSRQSLVSKSIHYNLEFWLLVYNAYAKKYLSIFYKFTKKWDFGIFLIIPIYHLFDYISSYLCLCVVY